MLNQVNDEGPIIEAYERREIDNGAEAVLHWAHGFKPGDEVLQIGFGRGAITQLLIDAGLRLSMAESSLNRLGIFQDLFPEVPSECSQVENCRFFSRSFDGVIVCGLTCLIDR